MKCSVSYCDHSPSIGVPPSVHPHFSYIYKYEPISTKLGQYVTIKSRMSWIIDVIRPELSKLHALEIKNMPFDLVYTVASININQSTPNLVTIYMTIRSQMSYIMDIIRPEHLELFALELGKIAEFDFVYTLAYTNIKQSVPTWSK